MSVIPRAIHESPLRNPIGKQFDKLEFTVFSFGKSCGIILSVMYMKTSALFAIILCLILAGCRLIPAPPTQPGVEILESRETTVPTETLATEPEETTQPTQPVEIPPIVDLVDGGPDMEFRPVNEKVTAKIEVNLRSIPSQGEESKIMHTLENGETVKRTGISSAGWSELNWNGKICYAVSSYLTTDLNYKPPVQIKTPFEPVDEQVTPKDAVNLRTLPSTTHPDVQVVVKLEKGEIVTRTGINEDVGWSRVEYNGQILYCISSYLRPAENTTE